MQTGTINGPSQSVLGILRNTLAKEGVRGIYRGVSAPIVAVSPVYALSFWGYDVGQLVVKMFKTDKEAPLNLGEIAIAGGLSAFPATAVMAPTERIKCLLQVQSYVGGKPQYSGMMDCAIQVYRTGGISSLYKGTALTLMRDGPGSIAWFSVYELMKREMVRIQGIDDPSQLSAMAVMVAGGCAGMACWVRKKKQKEQQTPFCWYRIFGRNNKKTNTFCVFFFFFCWQRFLLTLGCGNSSRCSQI